MFTNILKEPLVQFFLSGFVLYGVYNIVADDTTLAQTQQILKKDITLSAYDINKTKIYDINTTRQLAVYKAVLLHEAYFLKLYMHESAIDKLLLQKMEFILAHAAKIPEPSEDELHTFYMQHKEDYGVASAYSFTLLPLSHTLTKEGAEDLCDRLNMFHLYPKDAHHYTNISVQMIKKRYGKYILHKLSRATKGIFTAQVIIDAKPYLLYLNDKTLVSFLDFDSVEGLVYQDYLAKKKLEAKRKAFDAIEKNYTIKIQQ